MAIRLSGLTSGMDTDAIVQELVSAYSKKTEKYEKASTKLTWKQDAWKGLNTKIYDLYTKVSNMRYSSAYNLRKTSVSDATKATVTASANAVTGTQKLKINSTAQSSYMTGAYLGEGITADSTLEDLGYKGSYTKLKLKDAEGKVTEIGVKKDTKISEVLTKIKDAGLNASLDTNNGRIFVNAKTSGEKSDFTLYGDSVNALDALDALGLNTALVTKDAQGNVTGFTDAAGSFATYHEYYTKALEAAGLTESSDEAAKDAALLEYMKGVYNDYTTAFKDNTQLKIDYASLNNSTNASKNLLALYERQAAARTSLDNVMDAIKDKMTEDPRTLMGDYNAEDISVMIKDLRNIDIYEKDKDGKKTNKISEDAINKIIDTCRSKIDPDGTMEPDEAAAKSKDEACELLKLFDNMSEDVSTVANYVKSHDDITTIQLGDSLDGEGNVITKGVNTLIEAAKKTIEENEVELKKYQDDMAANQKIIDANAGMIDLEVTDADGNIDETKLSLALGEFVDKAKKAAEIYANSGNKYDGTKDCAVKIKGSNAEIELNGVKYTSESNSFAINGLTINTLATTNNEEISITTSVDTQGIYDKVKEFLTEYNNVINEMCKLYNADSAGDYEPLTDEEKEAMSDEQIEKWETKIKDSLLRRDTTLNSIMSVMVNAMATSFEIDGQSLSLSTFGIQTLGFLNAPKNEHYAYHIDGDEDDENTSGKKDKLMQAIEANPEQVEEFMKKLCENLYSAVDNKMKSTELSSAYKVYNDKEMDKELKKYAEAISKWEEKVKDKEDYYFKQFSNMEVALSKLQNQTSSISGLLG